MLKKYFRHFYFVGILKVYTGGGLWFKKNKFLTSFFFLFHKKCTQIKGWRLSYCNNLLFYVRVIKTSTSQVPFIDRGAVGKIVSLSDLFRDL